MKLKYHGKYHNTLLSIISTFLKTRRAKNFIELEDESYSFTQGFRIDSMKYKKAKDSGFVIRGKERVTFQLQGDSSVDYGNYEKAFDGLVDHTLFDIKTGKGLRRSLDREQVAWIIFENINFESVGESVLSITKRSAVLFENCSFKRVRVNSQGIVKCLGCNFEEASGYLLASEKVFYIKECAFKNASFAIKCKVKSMEEFSSTIENCQFEGLDTGLELVSNHRNYFQVKVSGTKFIQCQVPISGLLSTLLIEQVQLQKPVNTAVNLKDCLAHFSQVKFIDAPRGLNVSGNDSCCGLFYSAFIKCGVGASLIARTLDQLSQEKHLGILRTAWIANCSFIKNNEGLRLENYRCALLGCTFVASEIYSIELCYPQLMSKLARNLNRPGTSDKPLRFESNNFLEFNPKVTIIKGENVLKRFKLLDPKVFEIREKFEVELYMENIVERLRSGYLQACFYRQNLGEALIRLNSVRALLLLNKDIKPKLLSSRYLKSELRLCYFLASFKIDPKTKYTLFLQEDVLDAWTDFGFMEKYDEAIEILKHGLQKGTIQSQVATKKIKELWAERRMTFLKKKLNRQRSYVMENLANVAPLKALTLITTSSKLPEYVEVCNKDGAAYKKLEAEVLLRIATHDPSDDNEEILNVKWVHRAAMKLLLERMEGDLQEFINLYDYSTPDIRKALPIALNIMLSNGQYQKARDLLLHIRTSGAVLSNEEAALLDEANGVVSANFWDSDRRATALSEATRSYQPGQPVPLLIERLFSFGRQSSIEKGLENLRVGIFDENLRRSLIYGVVYDNVAGNSHLKLNSSSKSCSQCGIYLEPSDVIKPCNKVEHVVCAKCFVAGFTGYCPINGCGVLVNQAEMWKSGVAPEQIYNFQETIFNSSLTHYISSIKAKWYNCPITSCLGGASRVDKEDIFICCVCGMFGFGNNHINFSENLERAWRDKKLLSTMLFLYKEAATGSNFVEHYFPYTLPNKVFWKGKEKDLNKLLKVMERFPTQPKGLNKIKDPLVFMLIKWVMESNPTHIRRLDKKDYPKFLPEVMNNSVPLQSSNIELLQVQSPQDKELTFQRLKKKHGAYWAFHGSNIRNWHSIIRNGLKVYSGTRFMTDGATEGNGIYHSPESTVSLGYSGAYIGYNNYIQSPGGKQKFAMAVIEVVSNDVTKWFGTYYVARTEDQVQLRYIIVGRE
eukprot:snap_masked-scaffold_7-processed-gene-17.3-mRNA-1 protein AED:1.00 eAED:1.00 QI:0/-1/0/0/-1/1/1/0/1182